jgi:hypothetical protein
MAIVLSKLIHQQTHTDFDAINKRSQWRQKIRDGTAQVYLMWEWLDAAHNIIGSADYIIGETGCSSNVEFANLKEAAQQQKLACSTLGVYSSRYPHSPGGVVFKQYLHGYFKAWCYAR